MVFSGVAPQNLTFIRERAIRLLPLIKAQGWHSSPSILRQVAPGLLWGSPPHGALGPHVLRELVEGDAAVLVPVHLLHHLLHLLEAHEVASRLDHALQLVGADGAGVVEVERVEGLVHVEAGAALQALAEGLVGVLDADVGAPHGLELEGGVGQEDVVPPDDAGHIVGTSSVHHVGVVGVVGEEGLRELREVQPAVALLAVAGDEQVALVVGGVDADGVQARLQLVHRDGAVAGLVEDVEGVVEVEVRLVGQVHLGGLQLLLQVAELLEGVHQLVLVVEAEDGLAGGREAGGADRGAHWGGVGGSGLLGGVGPDGGGVPQGRGVASSGGGGGPHGRGVGHAAGGGDGRPHELGEF
mmetsp:Transcript_8397/g.14042  ORF Transcript_8397/g.14042 Transcript_8397/m.14042 type:complete len:355 (-) Transcript_8397:724-1788(-)